MKKTVKIPAGVEVIKNEAELAKVKGGPARTGFAVSGRKAA